MNLSSFKWFLPKANAKPVVRILSNGRAVMIRNGDLHLTALAQHYVTRVNFDKDSHGKILLKTDKRYLNKDYWSGL